ncbi:hypothetical protein M0657_005004 [Pyricularia oryzae]|uniref:GPI anchored serine-threonine rich protein n=2 Tax=Pyricularia oryzae TaxID=318829 RepID=A0AA97P1B4_PYRO3|nr:hypothetical protein OOU_Y34scaffold00462g59 [Pyricularia oryzae Y34]KAI7918484.1 hypothetical protein M9X92_006887 [Pyricularia oryzae]KAI7923688.1 hypothetical protein M0657_005004 [Pyricularia oryzae]
MKSFFVLPFALLAATVAAQDPSCGATYIVDACLTGEKAKFNACEDKDWGCKCASYEAIVTCFNNCPNDPRKTSEEGQKSIFCGYNSQFPSSTTTASIAAATGASTTAAAATTSSSSTGSSTAAQPSQTGAAADLVMNAGGILAVVAAVVVAVL